MIFPLWKEMTYICAQVKAKNKQLNQDWLWSTAYKLSLLSKNINQLWIALKKKTLCDSWTVAHQAPLSMGFPRQEYWSGLPLPFPGDLPNPGIEPVSPPLVSRPFTTEGVPQ